MKPEVLLIEPYYGGSHRAFTDGLRRYVPGSYHLLCMPPRKWKWRMRGSALYFAEELQAHPMIGTDVLFCSSFLGLADFKAAAPAYSAVPSIAYFHENQLTYPVRVEDERDFHFGLTNVTTCLAADVACFNSRYNLESFLEAVERLLAKMPDCRPARLVEGLHSKSRVLAPPIDYSAFDGAGHGTGKVPRILWNHRWEHDKNPEGFFDALYRLAGQDVPFEVSILGERFAGEPAAFAEARERLGRRVVHFGYLPDRAAYAKAVAEADIAVSTANHEFFGMSMLEASYAGCFPLLPRRLSYPEIFPDEFLYEDERDLVRRLHRLLAETPERGRARNIAERYSWERMASEYEALLEESMRSRRM
ncbi:MAG: DUF3524 domain-containing protein [Actinobacteria bacterium]|nr:MAG: DUF3524 domain-containing protein [Actinomycetota bacterium]